MALNGDDDYDWEPPTEAEMKVLEAQRERQNKISKLMGDYLLKGYKMLGDCCQRCSTILLEDRQKNIYCVACQELDSDVDKDNPALNAQAALSQVRERQLASLTPPPQQPNGSSIAPPSAAPRPIRSLPRPEHCEGAASGGRAPAPAGRPAPAAVATPATTSWSPNSAAAAPLDTPTSASPVGGAAVVAASGALGAGSGGGIMQHTLNEAEQALLAKLQWASTQLDHAPSVESSIQLCQLIASCATSLRSLRELHRD